MVSSFTVVCNLMVLNTYEWMDILYYVCHVMVFVALDFMGISAPRYVCGLNQIGLGSWILLKWLTFLRKPRKNLLSILAAIQIHTLIAINRGHTQVSHRFYVCIHLLTSVKTDLDTRVIRQNIKHKMKNFVPHGFMRSFRYAYLDPVSSVCALTLSDSPCRRS